MRTAYDECEFCGYIKKPLHCRNHPIFLSHLPIVSFRGGLSSEYQVVGNQRTPLVIVQIDVDLVTPSPFSSSTPVIHIFAKNIILVASIAHYLESIFAYRSFEPDIQLDTLSGQLSRELIQFLIWQLAVFSYSLLICRRLRIYRLPGNKGAWFVHQSRILKVASTSWKLRTLHK